VAQCLKTPRNSSYQVDETQFFANYPEKVGSDKEEEEVVVARDANCMVELDVAEQNILYYLTGWGLNVVPTNYKECSEAYIATTPSEALTIQSELSILKEYKANALRNPTPLSYDLIQSVEKTFVVWQDAITEVKSNVLTFLLKKVVLRDAHQRVAPCTRHHDMITSIIKKYLTLRLHIACSRLSVTTKVQSGGFLGSRSMAMRAAIEK